MHYFTLPQLFHYLLELHLYDLGRSFYRLSNWSVHHWCPLNKWQWMKYKKILKVSLQKKKCWSRHSRFRPHRLILWNPIHKTDGVHCSAKFYTLHFNAVILAGYSKHVLLSLCAGFTFLERQAGAPLCVSESVKVCVPLRAEKARLPIWHVPGETAEHPGHRCVELRSAGDSAGRGLLTSSAHRRARQSRIPEAFCRSYNASLLHSRYKKRRVIASVTATLHMRPRTAFRIVILTQQSRRSSPACCSHESGMFQDLYLEAPPQPVSGSFHQQTNTSHPDVANSSRLLSEHTYCEKKKLF